MATFGEKMWVVLITLTMLRHKYVKSRSLSLDVENGEYIVGCNFGGCLMICSKLQRGASGVHWSLRKPEKGKSMITLGLNFCLFRVTIGYY